MQLEEALRRAAPAELCEFRLAEIAPQEWSQWKLAPEGTDQHRRAEAALTEAAPRPFARLRLLRTTGGLGAEMLVAVAPSEWAEWVSAPSASPQKSRAEAALVLAASTEFALFLLAQAAPDEWSQATTWQESAALEAVAPVEFWEAFVATRAPGQWAQWRVAQFGSNEQSSTEAALIRAAPLEFAHFLLARRAPREFSGFRQAVHAEDGLILTYDLAGSAKWGSLSDTASQSLRALIRVAPREWADCLLAQAAPESWAAWRTAPDGSVERDKATLGLIRGAPEEWAERRVIVTAADEYASWIAASEFGLDGVRDDALAEAKAEAQAALVRKAPVEFCHLGLARYVPEKWVRWRISVPNSAERTLAEKALADAAPRDWAAAELAASYPDQWARFDVAPLGLEKGLAAAALVRAAPVTAWRAISTELYFARAHLAEEAPELWETWVGNYYEPEGRNAKRALIRAAPKAWAESELIAKAPETWAMWQAASSAAESARTRATLIREAPKHWAAVSLATAAPTEWAEWRTATPGSNRARAKATLVLAAPLPWAQSLLAAESPGEWAVWEASHQESALEALIRSAPVKCAEWFLIQAAPNQWAEWQAAQPGAPRARAKAALCAAAPLQWAELQLAMAARDQWAVWRTASSVAEKSRAKESLSRIAPREFAALAALQGKPGESR